MTANELDKLYLELVSNAIHSITCCDSELGDCNKKQVYAYYGYMMALDDFRTSIRHKLINETMENMEE